MPAAKVSSIDALRDLKSAIARFIAEATASVAEVDSESLQTAQWLRFDQTTHWQSQARQRHEFLEAAKAELRRKQLTGLPDNPTAIDQRRAVDRARQREEAALEKIQRVRRWLPLLERETTLYKGGVQQLLDATARDLPAAMLTLDRMIRALEEYAAVSASQAGPVSALPPAKEALDLTSFSSLRRRTPRRAVREAVPVTPLALRARSEDQVHGPPGGILAQLSCAPCVPKLGDKLVLQVGALDSGAFYLERLADPGDGDSGWFVGSAAPMMSGDPLFEATTVQELLAKRPALNELLQVPAGYLLVVMGGGGADPDKSDTSSSSNIEVLLSPEDRQVYP